MMKTQRCRIGKRLTAGLLTVALAVGMFALGAAAARNDREYFYNDLTAVWEKSWDEQLDAYRALSQKYSERADAHYALAQKLDNYSNLKEEEMAELDKALELAEKYPKEDWFVIVNASQGDLMEEVCRLKAELYLKRYDDQEEYIAWMRKSLDAKESDARTWLDGGINWSAAVQKLQLVEVQRTQLDEIERWYQEGAASFQAWQGGIQGTVGADQKSVTVTMTGQKSGSECTITTEAVFEQPILGLLRGVEQMRILRARDNKETVRTTYRYADGRVEEETAESVYQSIRMDITDICQQQAVSFSLTLKQYLQEKPSLEQVTVSYLVS